MPHLANHERSNPQFSPDLRPPRLRGAMHEPGVAVLARNKANRVPRVHRPAPPEMVENLPEVTREHSEHLLFKRAHNVAPRHATH